MTELYIPQPGERVRVTDVHPQWDRRAPAFPEIAPGTIHVVVGASVIGNGWLEVWFENGRMPSCRVEPIEKREEPAPELSCCCGHAGCPQCDRAPEPAEPERRQCIDCSAEPVPDTNRCAYCERRRAHPAERGYVASVSDLDTRIREAQPVYELGAAWSSATDES